MIIKLKPGNWPPDEIRALVFYKHKSIAEFCRLTGLRELSVGAWINGKTTPTKTSRHALDSIAHRCGFRELGGEALEKEELVKKILKATDYRGYVSKKVKRQTLLAEIQIILRDAYKLDENPFTVLDVSDLSFVKDELMKAVEPQKLIEDFKLNSA